MYFRAYDANSQPLNIVITTNGGLCQIGTQTLNITDKPENYNVVFAASASDAFYTINLSGPGLTDVYISDWSIVVGLGLVGTSLEGNLTLLQGDFTTPSVTCVGNATFQSDVTVQGTLICPNFIGTTGAVGRTGPTGIAGVSGSVGSTGLRDLLARLVLQDVALQVLPAHPAVLARLGLQDGLAQRVLLDAVSQALRASRTLVPLDDHSRGRLVRFLAYCRA